MGRNKGTFGAAFNFEVKMQEALDPRVLVDVKADLINKETWPYSGETLYLYEGLVVAVKADKTIYMLTDITKVLNVDYSGWKQLDVSAQQVVEIINNLTSSSITAALSANQGRVLKGEVDALAAKLSSIYKYKGTVQKFAELPTDAVAGDVYNVVEKNGDTPAGSNYAWTGTVWDALGGTIDLSEYLKITDADAKYIHSIGGNIELANTKAVKGAKSDGTKLNLVSTLADGTVAIGDIAAPLKVIGSAERPSYSKGAESKGELALVSDVAAGDTTTLQTAKEYADQKVADIDFSGYVAKEAGKELIPTEKLALIDTNKTDIDTLQADVTAAEGKITALETALPAYVKVVAGENTDSIITDIKPAVANADKIDIAAAVVSRKADGSYTHDADKVVSLPKATTTKAGLMGATDKVALDNTVAKVTVVEGKVATAEGKITTLETGTAAADAKIATLEGKVATAETNITKNTGDIAALDTTSAEHTAGIAKNVGDIAAVKSTADSAAAALIVLNGSASVNGSVTKTATTIAKAEAAAAVSAALAWIEVTA